MELTAREKRLLLYLAIFLVILAWDCARRRWSPDIVTETEHYVVYSTATRAQTEEIGRIAEIVYQGYVQLLDQLDQSIQPHPKLKAKLFRNREEFRLCNRVRGWAEAFYRKPYCCQYYSSSSRTEEGRLPSKGISERSRTSKGSGTGIFKSPYRVRRGYLDDSSHHTYTYFEHRG